MRRAPTRRAIDPDAPRAPPREIEDVSRRDEALLTLRATVPRLAEKIWSVRVIETVKELERQAVQRVGRRRAAKGLSFEVTFEKTDASVTIVVRAHAGAR